MKHSKKSKKLVDLNIESDLENINKEFISTGFMNQTENKLIEINNEEQYISHLVSIIESSDDAIISKSLDGIIKSWNKGCEKMFGYTSEQAVGKHISLIIPFEYINEEKIILEKIRNNEKIDNYETVRNRSDGKQFYVSLTVSPLKDKLGNIVGISKIARDISFRKKAEADFIFANKELNFNNIEKGKRASELFLINKELVFQNQEKEKLATELIKANQELAFQNQEKEKRAAELLIANEELVFQNQEKEYRAAELIIANKELAFQNQEKENRAAELLIANEELVFQNQEKENRAAELLIANEELVFQNQEKENRAAELIIANKELAFQNQEKEKRAAELLLANEELVFQNQEKEKRAAELLVANKELDSFTFISSHHLQEPLRKIQTFCSILIEKEQNNLSENGKFNFQRIEASAKRMQQLINDLLSFSRIKTDERKYEKTNIKNVLDKVLIDLNDIIIENQATINVNEMCSAEIIGFQFNQLLFHLINNALKFSQTSIHPIITISSRLINGKNLKNEKLNPQKDYCHIMIKDNGIGFESRYNERIFEVFQKLHNKETYSGTGIGLAIVKKIVANHNGIIIASGELNKGACFDIYIPN